MSHSRDKIASPEEWPGRIAAWREAGDKIVFTNGCFDLLHAGHVDYLEAARRLGDRLVIGLNDDDSLRRLKGEGRPLVPQDARARLLAGLQCVDLVILFPEDTPEQLIGQVFPDILVKGGDYRLDQIVGRDIVLARGGEVLTIPLTKGFSTSSLIDKIKEVNP